MNSFREVHFQDRRLPHDVRSGLEREMMMLFQPTLEASRLKYCANGAVNGVPCRALLQFEAAGLLSNCYSYRLEADGTGLSASALTENQAYLKGWFELWTRKYSISAPPTSREDLTSRYQKIASDAMAAESHLESVTAVQHEILNCLRRGATFSTAHKEGGSDIRFQRNRFLCADYGDSNRIQEFNTEAAFLAFLRKFYQWEISRNMRPNQASELAAWKLILRLLRWDLYPAAGESKARAVAFYTKLNRLRSWGAGIVLVTAIGVAVVLGLGSRLLSVKSIGRPTGSSVRTRNHIATLITTVEPYIPSLHHRPESERHRLDLLLHPLDGTSPIELIAIARRLSAPAAPNAARILGVDGDVVWLVDPALAAYDLKSRKLVTAKDLARINPALGDLLDLGYPEFDGHLRLSSRDQLRICEFDPTTFIAQHRPKPERKGWISPTTAPEEFQCAGARWSTSHWFGVHSTTQIRRDFRPGASLSKDYPVERSREPRQLYRGHLNSTNDRSTFESMELLTSTNYYGAALLRESPRGGLLKLTGPDGFLLTSLHQNGSVETLMIHRVDLQGQIQWQADTGITELDQILPAPRTLAIIGKQAAPSGKLPKPVLVILNNESGALSSYSLLVGE